MARYIQAITSTHCATYTHNRRIPTCTGSDLHSLFLLSRWMNGIANLCYLNFPPKWIYECRCAHMVQLIYKKYSGIPWLAGKQVKFHFTVEDSILSSVRHHPRRHHAECGLVLVPIREVGIAGQSRVRNCNGIFFHYVHHTSMPVLCAPCRRGRYSCVSRRCTRKYGCKRSSQSREAFR